MAVIYSHSAVKFCRYYINQMFVLLGKRSLHKLPKPLLYRHRSRDEGDLHIKPHVEPL